MELKSKKHGEIWNRIPNITAKIDINILNSRFQAHFLAG